MRAFTEKVTLAVESPSDPFSWTTHNSNDDLQEKQNAITSSGQTLIPVNDPPDNTQLAEAVAIYAAGGDFYTDGGTPNAYVLTPVGDKAAPNSYFNGMRVRFRTANANTGASTINVNGIGVVDLVRDNGGPLGTDEVRDDRQTNARFNSASGAMHIFVLSAADAPIFDPLSVKTTVITATNTLWIPDPLTVTIKFKAIGGGGGGGATLAHPTPDNSGVGGSGGGGGMAQKSLSMIDTSYNITIGAKGIGGPAPDNPGTAGGNTSVVGTLFGMIQANGGGFGAGSDGDVSAVPGGIGGDFLDTPAPDLGLYGGDGSYGGVTLFKTSTSLKVPLGRFSGASVLGGKRQITTTTESATTGATSNGLDGRTFGSGGTGAGQHEEDSHATTGGDGAPGVVFIEEYF